MIKEQEIKENDQIESNDINIKPIKRIIKLKKGPDISKLDNLKYKPILIDEGLRYYNDRDKLKQHNRNQQESIYAQNNKINKTNI